MVPTGWCSSGCGLATVMPCWVSASLIHGSMRSPGCHRRGALLQRRDAELAQQVEDLRAGSGCDRSRSGCVHLHARARGAPVVAGGRHRTGAQLLQAQLQRGGHHEIRLGGQRSARCGSCCSSAISACSRSRRTGSSPLRRCALDVGEGAAGALDLAFLALGLGRQQAIAVGVAADWCGQRRDRPARPGRTGLAARSVSAFCAAAISAGERWAVMRHAGGERQAETAVRGRRCAIGA